MVEPGSTETSASGSWLDQLVFVRVLLQIVVFFSFAMYVPAAAVGARRRQNRYGQREVGNDSESTCAHDQILLRFVIGLTFLLVLMDHWIDHFLPSHLKSVVLVGRWLSREGINTKHESTSSGLKTT